MLEILNGLFDTGIYKKLLNAGLISPKLSNYRDYCMYVNSQVASWNISKTAAIKKAAAVYGVDERTIRRALTALSN